MITYSFSEDFSKISDANYLGVYNNQVSNFQDYFHHPKFQECCLSVFSKYEKCYLLSVFNKEELIGYAAFRNTKLKLRGLNYHVFAPVSYRVSEYNYPVINQKYIEVFFNIYNKVFKGHNLYLPGTPNFFKRRIIDNVKNSFVYSISENPVLVNFENKFEEASKKKGIVRDFKQLSNKFELEIEHHTKGIRKDILNEFFEVHIKRWKNEGIDSKFILPKFKEIYQKLVDLNIEEVGSPIINILKANKVVIAMHYGFLSKKRFIYQVPVYNTEFKTNKSPGSILLIKILEYGIENNFTVFDMGIGMESYKYRFMNDIETYYNITVFKNPVSSIINRLDLK